MNPVITLTETQTLQALRSFIQAVCPSLTAIVEGQTNRVPEPIGNDFVTMTPIMRDRLETNTNTYTDGFPSQPSQVSALTPMKVTVQLDVHGPQSADNTHLITTMFRSDWGVQQFQASGFDVTPLYTSEPNQMPFDNGEQQVEERWSIDAILQCNPVIIVPQQFFTAAEVGLIDVDVVYPPVLKG